MDSKRVLSLFAKYGIDKTKMKRTYDPDSGTVELSMKLDTNIANKIGDALEALPTADDNYGGYIIESTKLVKENDNSFLDEFTKSADVIKYLRLTFLPATYYKIFDQRRRDGKELYRPSAPKMAISIANMLKQNNIDSLETLYKINKLKYTGSETIKDFLNTLKIEKSKFKDPFRDPGGNHPREVRRAWIMPDVYIQTEIYL
jgi:hypothetical protein